MDQAPIHYNHMPTQFGPPPPPPLQPYMGEQFKQLCQENYNVHEQHPSVDPFMDAVNAEIWATVQAYHSMDAQSLHQAYANLGFVLGIDRACTYNVQSYSSANPAFGGSRRTPKLFFKKDWENLEAMVAADVDNEKKIVHVEEFMKRRRIPGYVSLYAPKQIVCEKLQVKQEKISCADDTCHTEDKVMRLDVACQTQNQSTISLNVACQTETFRSSEAGCQTERFVSYETPCQIESFVNLDVACQTVEKFVGLSVSCQTCEKSSSESVDKVVRKGSDNRKHARDDEQDSRSIKRSKNSDSTGDARNKASSQDPKSSTHQNGSGRTEESEHKSRAKDDKIVRKDSDSHKHPRVHEAETSATGGQHPFLSGQTIQQMRRQLRRAKSLYESKKKLMEAVDNQMSPHARKYSSDNCKRARGDKSKTRSAKRSDSKDSAQKCGATKSSASKNISRRRTDAVDSRKSYRDSVVSSKVLSDPKDDGGVAETKRSPSHCKPNSGSYDCHVTTLVIHNLHPLVNDADISTIFRVFKSYKSSKVNFYECSELCAADVVFQEEADALEAKKQFDGKKLDGYPMHIVVVKSEKN